MKQLSALFKHLGAAFAPKKKSGAQDINALINGAIADGLHPAQPEAVAPVDDAALAALDNVAPFPADVTFGPLLVEVAPAPAPENKRIK